MEGILKSNKKWVLNKKERPIHQCTSKCKNEATAKTTTHNPSIRCHEETAIHIHTPACEQNVCPAIQVQKSYLCDKENALGIKPWKSPRKTRHSTVNSNNKMLNDQSIHWNSVPLCKNHNLEESVDYIPVKLLKKSSTTSNKQLKSGAKSVSDGKINLGPRPTWNDLLKADNLSLQHQNVNQNDNWMNNNHNCSSTNTQNSPEHPLLACKGGGVGDAPISDDSVKSTVHVSDLVKTLDYLIEQLRKKILMKPENDNLKKIIVDMENALGRISFEDQAKTTVNYNSEIASSFKSAAEIFSKSPKSSDTKQTDVTGWEIHSLKKGLEEGCNFLQSLCIKQREKCTDHLREKEQLSIQLAESRRLLALAKSKETEYEKTIGGLRLDLQVSNSIKDQHSKNLQEMSDTIAKLKTDNEALNKCAAKNDILQSKQLSLKDLEIEKLKVLLQVKQNLKADEKQFIDKTFEEALTAENLKLDIPIDEKDNLYLLQSEASLSQCRPRIICSSQASSSPGRSPTPYDSWQHISSIPQDLTEINELRNSLVRVFNIMKADTEWSEPLDLEEPLLPSLSIEDDD